MEVAHNQDEVVEQFIRVLENCSAIISASIDKVEQLLTPEHAEARLAAIREHKRRTATNWTHKDAAATDRSGQEPSRSEGIVGTGPGCHGRRCGKEGSKCSR